MPTASKALNYQQRVNRSSTNGEEDLRNLFLQISANFDKGKINETNLTVTAECSCRMLELFRLESEFLFFT